MTGNIQLIADQMVELGKDPAYKQQVINACSILLQALKHDPEASFKISNVFLSTNSTGCHKTFID